MTSFEQEYFHKFKFTNSQINLTPVTNLQMLLGIAVPNPQKEKPVDVSYNLRTLPMEAREKFVFTQ